MADYTGLDGYKSSYAKLLQQQQGMHSNDTAGLYTRLNDVGSQFFQQFKNLVGRDPTTDEVNQFYSQAGGSIISNSPLGRSESNPTDVRNQIVQYVGDTGQAAAKDYATQQLKDQQGQANSLADLFRTQGNQAINDTEQSLLDYQSKLFDKLRPNLITSLKAQGLLDTGGLNEALAGAQGDLANSASGYLADARLNMNNQANAIAYGGASAPYQFDQANIMNQPGLLASAGTNALNSNYNTFLTNLNYQNQLGLIGAQTKAQQSLRPSFLQTLGQSAATSLGSNLNGPAWLQGMKESGGSAAVASARKFKKDITQLTEAEENALYDRMVNTPLNRWRYNAENDTPRHLGVITDEALPEMLTDDGDHLATVDYLGALTLALKVQHRKLMEIKAGK